MTKQEIILKIKDLEDKISDARYYISSDGCQTCERMYASIIEYRKEIELLKNLIKDYE